MLLSKILLFIVESAGAIGIIIFIIYAVKDVIGIVKYGDSILKFLWKFLAVILIVAIMYVSLNYESLGNLFGQGVNSAINQGAEDITQGIQ